MIHLKLSIRSLAKKADLAKSTVSRIVNYSFLPNRRTIEKLAWALRLPKSDVVNSIAAYRKPGRSQYRSRIRLRIEPDTIQANGLIHITGRKPKPPSTTGT